MQPCYIESLIVIYAGEYRSSEQKEYVMSNNKAKKNQQFIADAIVNYFDRNDWAYQHAPEHCAFTGEIRINGPLGSVNFIVFADDDAAVCYHILPFSASTKERSLLAEYLTRVNFKLNRGTFELDFDDGEIRFKNRISLADIKANGDDDISFLLYLGCSMIEQFSPGILAVSFLKKTPEEAYLDCINSATKQTETPEEN